MVDAFLNFFVAMAKRELFIWKRKHEAMLLREVLVEEPHKYRPGSKERGISWTKIAEHLQESGMKVTQRSAREKFDKLYQDFKKREKEESRASGVDVEYDEIYQALTNIHDQILKQEQQQGKEESEKATAEEMRKRATEKLSETKRRTSTEDEENSDGTCATPKKRKCHTSVTELLERSIERKASEQAEQQLNNKRELELRAEELRQQQQFQAMLLQQQQQFQQQQQHFQQQQ